MKLGIVGAGLAGLSIAAAVDPRRVEVTILERQASIEPLGGGLIIQPNAVRALAELDCRTAVERAGTELTHLVQHREGVPVEIRLREVWPRLGLPTIAAHRHAVHGVLLDRVGAHATLELSQEVDEVGFSEASRTKVRSGDGREWEFDVVIGADGIQSRLRKRLASSSTVRELGLWWARWLVPEGNEIERRWQTERVGQVAVGAFPLGREQVQVFATIPGGQMLSGQRERTLADLIEQAPVLRLGKEHDMQLVHVGPAREVWPHAWGGEGFLFAGDAAHAMPPTLSAGGGLAIEDGLVCGRLVSSGSQGGELAGRYRAMRSRRLSWMAKVGRIQVSTMRGSPSPPSSSLLTSQMRSLYEPLDEPGYLEPVTVARVGRAAASGPGSDISRGTSFYERAAADYARRRRTEPRIAAPLWRSLEGAARVLNVGAGIGAYEPTGAEVVAVEPARAMRARRPPGAARCVAAVAERLPFAASSFDAVMSVFSHWHWGDQEKGFAEMLRVAREQVAVLTVDRSIAERFWLSREYLPNAHALWGPFERTLEWLEPSEVVPIPIPADCVDGFFHAYWRRPSAYLDGGVRESMAVFARLDREETEAGLTRLADDLDSGRWHARHALLLEQTELDLGCRLLVRRCA